MSRHSNISIFIPHLGCPHQCTFCDQRTISGTAKAPTADEVRKILEKACDELPTGNFDDAEIAFFGGSFTAVQPEYMTALLRQAYPFVQCGKVRGIRCSTRPDAINRKILETLLSCGVTAIELGAQSMDDEVLSANGRGHTALATEKACALIREYGFELGLQMMVGLYKSTPETDMATAKKILELAPDTVRVYPTVILKNTGLGELFLSGEYVPYPFDTAVEVCAQMLEMFDSAGIRVIKLGLHASETVEADLLGGYYHPAFRELCEGFLLRQKMEEGFTGKGNYTVYVSSKAVSKAVGQKKCNIEYFRKNGINVKILPEKTLKNREIIIEKDV